MTRDGARGRAIMVMTGAVAFAAAPLFGGGFGGFEPGAFPVPQDDPPIQPAGWAFSIWGVIYLWLIAHAVYGVLRRDVDADWDRTRVPMIAALAIGTAWIPVARQTPVGATALIALMLAASTWAFLRAPAHDRWWALVPIGLFAGWLTAATGVSIGLLVAGWGLAGPVTAALAVLVWTLALAAALLGLRPEPAYGVAVAWGLLGIVGANGLAQPTLSVLAGGGALAVLALAFRRLRPS